MIWAPHIRKSSNTTTDDQGHTLTYDAWNRLIAVTDSGSVLALYTYDGMGRQITQYHYGDSAPGSIYYSNQWQVLYMNRQSFVWSPVYVDALVLRDEVGGISTLPVLRTYVLQDADFNTTALVQIQLGPADTDGSDFVDSQDLNAIVAHWHSHTGNGIASGDLNQDGYVDEADYDLLLAMWQQPTSSPDTWGVVQREVYNSYGLAQTYNGSWVSGDNFVNMEFLNNGMMLDPATGLNIDRNRIYSPSMQRFVQPDPTGYPNGMDNFILDEDNPINSTDPTGLTRYIFAFEGLGGFHGNNWKNWKQGKDFGGDLLSRFLCAWGANTVAGDATGAAANGQFTPGPDQTVVSYYDYKNIGQALDFATAQKIGQKKTYNGKCYYDTVVIAGHSFGGDAAWRFAENLEAKTKIKGIVNLGITFDPRYPDKFGGPAGGNGFDGDWNNPMPALEWWNYYEKGITLLVFPPLFPIYLGGNVLPAPVHDVSIDGNHFTMISKAAADAQVHLATVGYARTSPGGSDYMRLN